MLSYKQPDEIGDVLQDIFVKIIKKSGKFKRRYAFSTWLYKIARNHVLDLYKKDKKAVIYNDSAIDKSGTLINFEEKFNLLECLSLLPLEQKEVILLKAEGFSFKEISKILFIPQNTAITRNARGIKKLKELLNNEK